MNVSDLDKIGANALNKSVKYDDAFKRFRKIDFWGRLAVGTLGSVVGSAGLITLFQTYATETPIGLATNTAVVMCAMVTTLYAVYNSGVKMQSTGMSAARYLSLHTTTINFQDKLSKGNLTTDDIEAELRSTMAQIDNLSRPL